MSGKKKMMLWFTVALLSSAVLARAQGARPEPDTTVGAKIYQNTCVRCHNAPEPRQRSPQSWQTIMAHMRVRGGLTANEAEAVLSFLQEQAEAPLPPRREETREQGPENTPAAAGRSIFLKQNCLACHSVGGQGGQVGPALDNVGSERTREQLMERMQARQRRPGDIMPTLPLSMAAQEINDLVDYLLTLRRSPPASIR